MPKVSDPSKNRRRTTLTKTLEAARERTTKSSVPDVPAQVLPAKPDGDAGVAQNLAFETIEEAPTELSCEIDIDVTTDLNEPHSQSGRYWKSEYDRYHEQAKAELRKLVKYKQLAKSYAKKRDSEATELERKLKEEQQKVTDMQARVSDLVSQVTARQRRSSSDNTSNQTRGAVLDIGELPRDAHAVQQLKHELRGAQDRISRMASLQGEVEDLRASLAKAEKNALRLQEENSGLLKDLFEARASLEKSECRREAAEIQREKVQKDYESVKEKAKSQRRDAETLLERRQKQVHKLKEENASLKQNITDRESQNLEAGRRKSSTQKPKDDGGVRNTTEIQQAAVDNADDLISFESPAKKRAVAMSHVACGSRVDEGLQSAAVAITKDRGLSDYAQPQQYIMRKETDLVSQPAYISWRSNAPDNGYESGIETPQKAQRKSSKHPLSEIINGNNNVSPVQTGGSLAPELQERFSNLSMASPKIKSSSKEPIERTRNMRYQASPRPSMFNILPSPTKMDRPKRQASAVGLEGPSFDPASSMLSSNTSRARRALPPDRFAAAKARIDQKMAEKRRAQSLSDQKENIR
jgi:hypothetical protein